MLLPAITKARLATSTSFINSAVGFTSNSFTAICDSSSSYQYIFELAIASSGARS